MPCTKCEEGKYKWGETGECEYDSLDACESANHKYKMQPTPLGKTYAEYEKELKEYNLSKVERVELANIKELDKFVKALGAAVKQIKSNRSKLGKSLSDIQAQRKEVEVQYNTAVENKKAVDLAVKNSEILSKEIVKQAKELGISPSEIPNVRELVDLIEQAEGAQETIDMFMNDAKAIINVSALK